VSKKRLCFRAEQLFDVADIHTELLKLSETIEGLRRLDQGWGEEKGERKKRTATFTPGFAGLWLLVFLLLLLLHLH
jgi:hypothetical protein